MAAGVQLNALDMRSLSDLKRLSRDANSPEGLKGAARQFEALFLQMVIKSMRDASPKDGLMDSDQTRMFQQLQDQQMALQMAHGRGVGLADVIYRQMGGKDTANAPKANDGQSLAAAGGGFDVASIPRRTALSAARAAPAAAEGKAGEAVNSSELAKRAVALGANLTNGVVSEVKALASSTRGFVRDVWQHAVDASASTGVPAQFMVAQAALETGWGRAVLKQADGSSSHNLFNIKAGSSWKGEVVELPVTEYANGRAYTEKARFRAYPSYAEAFQDYARLLTTSPRYADVVGQTDADGFARSLQEAGFATDPQYADKLKRIIGGNTLKVALSG